MSEDRIELRGGPASYTNLTVYRDNNHQLPPTVEMLVADGILDYKLTSAVTTPDGYPIYRCPTNWRLAVRPAPTAAPRPEPAAEVDPLDALLAALDQDDADNRH
ncbi:hypothetical protein [Cryptosporangium japonicum]|uniref:Uncharacterized protein n=1 Tax=Cryptosporangium japonicum TaxID=80872 RepID=A0ABP3DFJ9_9ACTN